jgi:hypothetical protein
MKNNILYPILIIIFSLLIIYLILKNKLDKKLVENIEKFENDYIKNNKDQLLNNVLNNSKFTKDNANGTWTSIQTTVDSNYNASNLITINVNQIIDGTNSSINNFGTISFLDNNFNITYILNENIVAVSPDIPLLNIHIKFVNNFTDENKDINLDFYKTDSPMAIVSIYINDFLAYKFVSYKVYNNKVGAELYRIIKSGDFIVTKTPQIYDFNTYNILINDYKYPQNYIKFNFGINDKHKLNVIKEKYNGNIKFSIERVFASPTGNEIVTKISTPVLLNAINNNNIPKNIEIVPFSNDKQANNLINFFKPKYTNLYFYHFTENNVIYDFADKNQIYIPNKILNLKNNSDKMFNPIIQYDNLNSVEKISTNSYKKILIKQLNSDLNNPTIINFSDVYNRLL